MLQTKLVSADFSFTPVKCPCRLLTQDSGFPIWNRHLQVHPLVPLADVTSQIIDCKAPLEGHLCRHGRPDSSTASALESLFCTTVCRSSNRTPGCLHVQFPTLQPCLCLKALWGIHGVSHFCKFQSFAHPPSPGQALPSIAKFCPRLAMILR